MKIIIVAVTFLAASGAFAAEATIGAKDCLIINPHPVPKETVKWSGPCQDGYAHGEGGLEWFNHGDFGSYYKGTLERGQKHGTGYHKSADGTEYEGAFVRGQREGQGVMRFPNGDSYDGQWKAGKPDGAGTMRYALGGRYEGQWKRGVYHGKGKATHAGGQVVEGEFFGGVAAGHAPRQLPSKIGLHALKDEGDYNWFQADAVTGSPVPYDKSYAQLTPDEQLAVKARYRLLLEGDEPPYPLQGTKRVFTWLAQAADKVLASGMLRLDVLVDREGNAESVTVHSTPHADMSRLAAQIVMAEKYKPARCSGKPCAMSFPYQIQFSVE